MRIDMEKHIVPKSSQDLYMSYYGHEMCHSRSYYGPAVRDHYLYVYIHKGKGIYRVNDQVYPLQEGQAFILFPHQLTSYHADEQDPWEYKWFGFAGSDVQNRLSQCSIDVSRPIITHGRPARMRQLFDELLQYEPINEIADDLLYNGVFCSMLAEICAQQTNGPLPGSGIADRYIQQATDFMQQHYDKNIQIEHVARFTGLERSYFSKLFKSRTGLSPHGYIMKLRTDKGMQLLLETEWPIEHIALIIGFKDCYHFSSFFKKRTGLSPLKFRKRGLPG